MPQNLVDYRCQRLALEREARGQGFVQDDTKREQIRLMVNALAERLLGGHVRHRADDRAQLGFGHRRLLVRCLETGHLGESEVQNLHPAPLRQNQVRTLDVAVDDAEPVRLVQGVRHLRRDLQGRGHRQWPAPQSVREGFAIDQLHHDEEILSILRNVVGRCNRRRAQD